MVQGRFVPGPEQRPDPSERVARKLEAVRRVLQLERAKGYADNAVFGGLERFFERWLEDPDIHQVLEQARIQVPAYSTLDAAARRSWVESALQGLGAPPLSSPSPKTPEPEEEAPGPSPAELRRGRSNVRPLPRAGRAARSTSQPVPARGKPAPPITSLDDALPPAPPRVAASLRQLGILTYRQALWTYPRRYLEVVPITGLVGGREQAITVAVANVRRLEFGRRGLQATQAVVSDASGSITAIWFGRSYLTGSLSKGRRFLLTGRLNEFRGSVSFNVQSQEVLDDVGAVRPGDLIPVYPLTQGITQRTMRRTVAGAIQRGVPLVSDFLPAAVRTTVGLINLPDALRSLHRPATLLEGEASRRRLAFDELLLLQLGHLERRRARQAELGAPIPTDHATLDRFLASLPFTLTDDQTRALEQALADMARSAPMSRLLQGDVGSGKTVVAAACLLMAATRGFQGALMAPTEVLAEQHFKTLTALFGRGQRISEEGGAYRGFPGLLETRPLRIALLTGSLATGAKGSLRKLLAQGQVDIAIGTHALIQGGVGFANLGLAVVDEQHRFGVEQRAALRNKGFSPHLLAMTATPIPRTLALALYGDLDVSTIRELPPGRPEMKTRALLSNQRESAYRFIRSQVAEGRQVFIICPLVEESEAIEAKSAVAEHKRLSQEVFPDLRVGLLHGRMVPREKQEVMERFQSGDLDILVSTAVVEVGIDVPNATVMVVEGADRFGLSQLHQYRGRVGRGQYPSYCLLLSDSPSSEAKERLKLVEETRDGFKLAEEDLRLRGPGEFFGTRQSGLPDLQLAILADLPLLEAARDQALRLIESDPQLSFPEHSALRAEVTRFWARAGGAPSSAA